jgi:hypothetical protein
VAFWDNWFRDVSGPVWAAGLCRLVFGDGTGRWHGSFRGWGEGGENCESQSAGFVLACWLVRGSAVAFVRARVSLGRRAPDIRCAARRKAADSKPWKPAPHGKPARRRMFLLGLAQPQPAAPCRTALTR